MNVHHTSTHPLYPIFKMLTPSLSIENRNNQVPYLHGAFPRYLSCVLCPLFFLSSLAFDPFHFWHISWGTLLIFRELFVKNISCVQFLCAFILPACVLSFRAWNRVAQWRHVGQILISLDLVCTIPIHCIRTGVIRLKTLAQCWLILCPALQRGTRYVVQSACLICLNICNWSPVVFRFYGQGFLVLHQIWWYNVRGPLFHLAMTWKKQFLRAYWHLFSTTPNRMSKPDSIVNHRCLKNALGKPWGGKYNPPLLFSRE